MAAFVYRSVRIEYRPDRGYLDPMSGEYLPTPGDAVSKVCQAKPDTSHHWVRLAQLITTFWAAHSTQPLGEFQVVVFD